ncbi:pseudouridine synthase [candidate division KSB1 bacterium]
MKQTKLNKFLSEAGIASRRKSDILIKSGKIKINGNVIREPWFSVDLENDKVEFEGKYVSLNEQKIYIMLNKPAGYVTTVSDEKNRGTVIDLVKSDEKIFPMGRLDKDSTGLLILTNDGDLTYKMTHPKFQCIKKYEVILDKPVEQSILQKMENGIWISKTEKVKGKGRISSTNGKRNVMEIQIFEGRKRQIRRMFAAFDYKVVGLKRVQFGGLRLSDLVEGSWRHLTGHEVKKLKDSIEN